MSGRPLISCENKHTGCRLEGLWCEELSTRSIKLKQVEEVEGTVVPHYHSTTVRCVLDWTGLTGVGWGVEVEVNHQKSDIK